MTSKIRVPLSQPWIDDLIRERDELRAQFNQYVRGAEVEASELRAENERLRAEYGFREDEVAVATNLPLTFVRKHASGNWRMPSDFTYLTYDEVVDLFDG